MKIKNPVSMNPENDLPVRGGGQVTGPTQQGKEWLGKV